jgi:predicted phage replisome organizer
MSYDTEKPDKHDKKKYWLKLEKDFLNSSKIKVIKSLPNGKDYLIFYLALMLESINTEGHLRFSELVPYNPQMLATITDTNIDIADKAITYFEGLGMLQYLQNGTIFLPDVPLRLGKEGESTERVRRFRERERQALLGNGNVTKSNDNKEEEVKEDEQQEGDIEEPTNLPLKSKNSINANLELILTAYKEICSVLPQVKIFTNDRKKKLSLRLKTYTEQDFRQAFEITSQTPFLKGDNDRNWKADFDWFVANDTNLAKVLEGKYGNKKVQDAPQYAN